MNTAAVQRVFPGARFRKRPAPRIEDLLQTPSRAFVAALLFTGWVTLVLGAWQYKFYCYHATNVGQMELSVLDRCLVYGVLCARVSVLLFPAAVMGLLAAWRRRYFVAITAAAVWVFGVTFWLLVEQEVYRTYGRTLVSLAGYIGQRQTWELGGGIGIHCVALIPVLLCALAVVCASFLLARVIVTWIASRPAHESRRRYVCVTVCWAILTAGPLAVTGLMNQPQAIATLNRALPAPIFCFGRATITAKSFVTSDVEASFAGSLARFEELMGRPPLPARASLPLPTAASLPLPTAASLPLRDKLPNIVMIVVESLRHDSLPGNMPHLESRLDDALVAKNHYANGNRTETGLFALMYGRPVIESEATLGRGDVPTLCHNLRDLGYACSFVSSHDPAYGGMDRFITRPAFDDVYVNQHGWWYDRDRQSLADAAKILNPQDARPKFVVVFLISTHYNYAYPPEYRHFVPDTAWNNSRVHLLNRYRNALRFTDDAIGSFLHDLDLSRNVVVVTGDHGESFYDDGALTHANRLSEITCRVPLVMFGGGIVKRRISGFSQHTDVLPTLLHVVSEVGPDARFSGRDLLGNEPPHRQVMVAQPLPNRTLLHREGAWEVLLIRPEGRMGFQVGTIQGSARLLGLYDEDGLIEPRHRLTDDNVNPWRDALRRELGHARQLPSAQ